MITQKYYFFHEDGRGGMVDKSDKEASTFIVDPSFRLTNLTNLHKYVTNKKVIIEGISYCHEQCSNSYSDLNMKLIGFPVVFSSGFSSQKSGQSFQKFGKLGVEAL